MRIEGISLQIAGTVGSNADANTSLDCKSSSNREGNRRT